MDPIVQSPASPTPQGGAGCVTANLGFGETDADSKSMFAVPAGVGAEAALNHASHILKCAYATAYELSDNGDANTGLVWSVLELVTNARALVDAVAEGMND